MGVVIWDSVVGVSGMRGSAGRDCGARVAVVEDEAASEVEGAAACARRSAGVIIGIVGGRTGG